MVQRRREGLTDVAFILMLINKVENTQKGMVSERHRFFIYHDGSSVKGGTDCHVHADSRCLFRVSRRPAKSFIPQGLVIW